MKTDKCLLCGNENPSILTEKLRYGKGKVFQCDFCGLAWLKDNRTQKQLNEYYAKEYRKKHTPSKGLKTNPDEIFSASCGHYQEERLNTFINKINPPLSSRPNNSLLEIGSSSGQFLIEAGNIFNEIYGVELDSKCAKFCEKLLQLEKGHIVNNIKKFEGKKFDVIALFQVLEHVKNPLEFIEDLKQYLDKDSYIAIEVPNLNDALLSEYNLPTYQKFYFHKAHLWYFNWDTLGMLMEKAGFKGSIHFLQDYNVINHMHWLINGKPQNNPFGLRKPTVFPIDSKSNFPIIANIQLNAFNETYIELLKQNQATSNIMFVGKLKDGK
jgi:2-polyprenyl-3-methyl-5-hydroxy-6-metoxy-1,4-benzoquinol methylase